MVPCLHLSLIRFMQVILGEEVAASKLTLFEITKQITDAVQTRAEQGLNNLNCLFIYMCVLRSNVTFLCFSQTNTME